MYRSPARPLGGVSGLAPGAAEVVSLDLAAGSYGLFCFLRDAGDGAEHAHHGMVKWITVS